MENYTSLLEEVLEAWSNTRAGVIDELKNIPGSKYDFRPAENVRSVPDVGIHILEVAMMMTGELTRPDTNFRRAPWPQLLNQYAAQAYRVKTKQELIKLLQSQLKEGTDKFRKAGELHMLQFIKRFDGKSGTRLAWLNHAIEQESYHCGQLTIYTRVLGLVPALTQKILGG
ncbi:MAG TPA: DinB family protein [Acidobacteriota bacterium]|nr:DinB family protein [Acidobacteriota bacterium]